MNSTTQNTTNTGNASGGKEDYVDKGKLIYIPSLQPSLSRHHRLPTGITHMTDSCKL